MKTTMCRVTQRWLLVSYFALIIVWLVVIIFMHMIVDGWRPVWFIFGFSPKFDHDQLKLLMASSFLDEHNTTMPNPLTQLLDPGKNFLHFFSLPKRKSHLIYSEVSDNCS